MKRYSAGVEGGEGAVAMKYRVPMPAVWPDEGGEAEEAVAVEAEEEGEAREEVLSMSAAIIAWSGVPRAPVRREDHQKDARQQRAKAGEGPRAARLLDLAGRQHDGQERGCHEGGGGKLDGRPRTDHRRHTQPR